MHAMVSLRGASVHVELCAWFGCLGVLCSGHLHSAFLENMCGQDGDKFVRSSWEKKLTRRNLSQEWWDDKWEVKKVVHAWLGDRRKASVVVERLLCSASHLVFGCLGVCVSRDRQLFALLASRLSQSSLLIAT